jgi:NADPH:quinone reductase-like Zn-dependent oxidoreductase
VKVGSDVDSTKPGDRVSVARWGKIVSDVRFGAYQKYPLAIEANTAKIGPDVRIEDASGVLVNLATVISALCIHIGLDRPPTTGKAAANGKTLLVYGGSSNVGGLAVKFASDAGYKVITTSSPANKDFVTTRNPTYVVDHTQPPENVVAELKAHGPYDAVFDAIGTPAATAVIGGVLAETGGVYYSTLPPGKDDKLPGNVEKKTPLYGMKFNEPANRHIKKWYLEEYLPQGLSNGNIFPNPILKVPGGLSSMQEALDKLSTNSASGVKIVINPQE